MGAVYFRASVLKSYYSVIVVQKQLESVSRHKGFSLGTWEIRIKSPHPVEMIVCFILDTTMF